MKILPLLLAVLISSVSFATGESAALPPLVTTSGSAVIHVAPDLADLTFEIEIRNPNLTVAREQHALRTTKVLSALRAAGVTEGELQSSQLSITPDYTDRGQETESVKFYRITQSIACTLHDVKKVPDVTAAILSAGATGVGEAGLRSSQLRKHRDQARADAMRAAKEKAVALANALGAKVGKPYSITEGSAHSSLSLGNSYSNSAQVSHDADEPGEGGTPNFAPGMINISASVTVAFMLE